MVLLWKSTAELSSLLTWKNVFRNLVRDSFNLRVARVVLLLRNALYNN